MSNIKFSIITASYNYEKYIKETIESVLVQTYSNWEMIIVDDGSKDNSIEVINEYCNKDERIKLYTHENNQNKGLIETVKLGIKKATSDWIVFLESDDTITPDYLQKKFEVIKNNPEVKFIFNDVNMFGNTDRINEYDKYFKDAKLFLKSNPYPKKQTSFFKRANLISTFSCVALKKELFDNLDFCSPIPALLDYYIWMQIANKTSFYFIDEKLTNWRMHDSYITKYNYNEKQAFKFEIFKFRQTINQKLLFIVPLYIFWQKTKILKKKIIRISFKRKTIELFGKKIDFSKKGA